MGDVMTPITSVVATGTAETAADTPKTLISFSMLTARSVSVATLLLWSRNAMASARCSVGVAMATATTRITTVAVIGMVETVAEQKQYMITVQTAVAKIQRPKAW